MHSGQLLRAAEAAEALDAALMQEGELQHALLFAALYTCAQSSCSVLMWGAGLVVLRSSTPCCAVQ